MPVSSIQGAQVAEARMILGMIIILVGSNSWAYTYENYLQPYTQGTSTLKIKKPKKSDETISLIIPSMVIH